jgi:hypothetical protein
MIAHRCTAALVLSVLLAASAGYYALTGHRISGWSIMSVISPNLRFRQTMEAPYARLIPRMQS